VVVRFSPSSDRSVVLTLDGDRAIVEGWRGRGRFREYHTCENSSEPAVVLRHVLRTSPMLRTGKRCDLRLIWDPARLLVRMSNAEQVDLSALDPDGVTVSVALDAQADRTIDAVVRRRDVDDIAAALESARTDGRARLDIGMLARTRRLIASEKDVIDGRCGMVIDVATTTVCVLRLVGTTVLDVRCAARIESARQASAMILALAAATPAGVEGWCAGTDAGAHPPWFWVDAPESDRAVIRDACRSVLTSGVRADLAIARRVTSDSEQGGRA
jgi:hypothetical protein